MHLALSDKIIEQYCAEGVLPQGIRPNRCNREDCMETKHIHRHGCFPRKSVFVDGVGWLARLVIQRFRCARCGKTFSIILPTHFKWQRAALSIQQGIALGLQPASTHLTDFSKRAMRDWVKKWNRWAETMHARILQWILRTNPNVSVDADAWTAALPLRYLHLLLAQLPLFRHGPAKVSAVARFGGVSEQAIPQCLSLSLSDRSCYPVNQGRAHQNLAIRGEPA